MSYDSIPNFNDPYSKVNERTHSSGAKIIEILYGAQDEQGNPKYPERKSDGHGHFVALEIDGMYQMLYWRHSKAEGGNNEFGIGRSNHPLADLEEDIEQKRKIIDEVWDIMDAKNYDTSRVDALLSQFSAIFDMNTPVEKWLNKRFNDALNRNNKNKKRFKEQSTNAHNKKKIISEAQEIQYSEDWKSTSGKMKTLMERWKRIGYAGGQDNQLWDEFNTARQTFFNRQRKHYENLDNRRSRNRQTKERIIADARSEAQYSTDWNGTHLRLEELFSEWKNAGSAGRNYDDKLWNDFQEIRNDFYARRKVARRERENEFIRRRQAKGELISEARAYASGCDYGSLTADRMRSLNSEWKDIGFCGKNYEDSLWAQFREAQDSYWLGKRQARAERHQAWIEKTQAAIDRRRESIYKIQANIDKLQERLYETRNYDKQLQIEGWISEDEEKIRNLEGDIYRMESELRG